MSTFSLAEDFIASLPALACPICCEPFSEGHLPVSVDGCRRVFGVECLKTWVNSGQSAQKTCPACRAVIFQVYQPGHSASAVVATNSPIINEAPYQPVISDSDYEYEGDEDIATICEEFLTREEQRAGIDRIRRQQREFVVEHDRRMEESRFIMQIVNEVLGRILLHAAWRSDSECRLLRREQILRRCQTITGFNLEESGSTSQCLVNDTYHNCRHSQHCL